MLKINLACWDYDRTRAIREGTVKVEGMDVNYIPLWVEETFSRMLRSKEFDVSEMSLSGYISSLFMRDKPLIAIPVFPSRTFRHRSIYVNKDSGIRKPRDLVGKKIGVYRFRQTAGVWIRGMLADNYRVPVDSVTYYSGGLERPELESKFWGMPSVQEAANSKIKIKQIGENQTLNSMLEDGGIDALYSARMPSSFTSRSKNVGLLFPDYVNEEMNYFKMTKIFPIMHTIAIRRKIYEKNRWMAVSLLKAFIEAKERAYKALYQTGALRDMLPWMTWEVEQSVRLMGKDYWPYGFRANRKTIETFLRYSYEQNLSERNLDPEEAFADETLDPYIKDEFAPPL
jgi:4,5-dihydroxyphthalate decarboxylase